MNRHDYLWWVVRRIQRLIIINEWITFYYQMQITSMSNWAEHSLTLFIPVNYRK
ncbi:hypothetical protein XSR1_540004 [Xenorhabdus szentirmaii DSM 16338]|uniref:Uncharacterized protein n=1 Tax=Xenorhabdus szentirmaii DSM 16338 TaxID=1427518 RepID=W1J242_9GAMM|nr:hypothetical protein XSR1_540004 [Xenorhabdus szentirmaii DSM 16338]